MNEERFNIKQYLFIIIVSGFLFGLGFELASWIVDSIIQFIGFPLG